jgi:hypothetical protein
MLFNDVLRYFKHEYPDLNPNKCSYSTSTMDGGVLIIRYMFTDNEDSDLLKVFRWSEWTAFVSDPVWCDTIEELLQQSWTGLCYSAALRWITVAYDSDCMLVHGTVVSGSNRFKHAWCESGNAVIDLVLPVGSQRVEREQYYRYYQPDVSHVYSAMDAMLLANINKHHGPWDDSEQLTRKMSCDTVVGRK